MDSAVQFYITQQEKCGIKYIVELLFYFLGDLL